MFFHLSKIAGLLTQPLGWALVMLVLAWVIGKRNPSASRVLVAAATVLIVLTGWLPLPDALLRRLEAQHPAVSPEALRDGERPFAGVIVVGGALDSAHARGGNRQVALNGAAERMTVPAALVRQGIVPRLVFTGGDGDWVGQDESEAAAAEQFFLEQGVPRERIMLESASRTTRENALLTAQMPGVDNTQRWLLVTSAGHMPRTVDAFRRAGWTDMVPYPVDYQTGLATPWSRYSLAVGADRWQTALHEYLGRVGYALRR